MGFELKGHGRTLYKAYKLNMPWGHTALCTQLMEVVHSIKGMLGGSLMIPTDSM